MKLDGNKRNVTKGPSQRFSTGNDFYNSLQNLDFYNQPECERVLTALRNQITVRAGEEQVSVDDGRLRIVTEWLAISEGARDVFNVANVNRQQSVASLCMSILASTLTLLSAHAVNHHHAHGLCKTLVSASWMRRIQSYLSGSHADLMLSTLKLLNALSTGFAGREQKGLLEMFIWDTKTFHKLLVKRRKGSSHEHKDILTKPDIRTLCIQFILSYMSPHCGSHNKGIFLERHRDIAIAIFRDIGNDPYPVARHVLEVCWEGVWNDHKVKRTTKVAAFSEVILQQIMKLYDRRSQEGPDPDDVPANLAHHFLLAVCTRPGIGVCFADKGWYPRSTENDGPQQSSEGRSAKGGRMYNKILSSVLKAAKVNEDLRQQELAFKIMKACPELVAGYWTSVNLTLEPRLSSKWLANIAFFGSVLSLPVPYGTFYLPASTAGSSTTPLYQPTPPPLSTVLENIIPSVNLKTHLSKGLQSSSPLVQHATAVALTKILTKYDLVKQALEDIARQLQEDDVDGQWNKRVRELDREIRKRLPDFQIVIALSQQKAVQSTNTKPGSISSNVELRQGLITEMAQRLLRLYYHCVPLMVAEVRFDVAKALQGFVTNVDLDEEGELQNLERLKQLHVLHTLRSNEDFIWSGKTASTTHSNIHILLSAFVKTEVQSLQRILRSLIFHGLSSSLVFQKDPNEIHLWLDSLPRSIRATDTESPDGAQLTDERQGVVAFLEECLQRCSKTPYKYYDDLDAFLGESSVTSTQMEEMDNSASDAVGGLTPANAEVSPLVMTVLEQLEAKSKSRLLSPSDTLAVLTYIRKVCVKLLGIVDNKSFFKAVSVRLRAVAFPTGLHDNLPIIKRALGAEVVLFENAFDVVSSNVLMDQDAETAETAVQTFLDQLEQLPQPATTLLAKEAAWGLIDWFRLVEFNLSERDVQRIMQQIQRFDSSVAQELFWYCNPRAPTLWDVLAKVESSEMPSLDFDWLLIHTRNMRKADLHLLGRLVPKALNEEGQTLDTYKRRIGVLARHLVLSPDWMIPHMFEILGKVFSHARSGLSTTDYGELKSFLFNECTALRTFCQSPEIDEEAVTALRSFLDITLDRASDSDKYLVQPFYQHCLKEMHIPLETGANSQIRATAVWIPFMSQADLLRLLDETLKPLNEHKMPSNTVVSQMFSEAFSSLDVVDTPSVRDWLTHHMTMLVQSRIWVSDVTVVDGLIALTVQSGLTVGLGLDGVSALQMDPRKLMSVAEAAWAARLTVLPPELDISFFLEQNPWTVEISQLISALIYRSEPSRTTFWTWVCDPRGAATIDIKHLARSLYAFIDCTNGPELSGRVESLSDQGKDQFQALCVKVIDALFSHKEGAVVGKACTTVLSHVIHNVPSLRKALLKKLQEKIRRGSGYLLLAQALSLATFLCERQTAGCQEFVEAALEHACHWATQCFSDHRKVELDADGVEVIGRFTDVVGELPVHIVEPVLTVAVKERFLNVEAQRLVARMLSKVAPQLKPANANRLLQSMIQHPQLHLIRPNLELPSILRATAIDALHTLFTSHPSNTCQLSHIQPLVFLYGGTLSQSDRKLLSILQLFEEERRVSVGSLLNWWSAPESASDASPLEAILTLDPTMVFSTSLRLPAHRSLSIKDELQEYASDTKVFDPVFLLLLFAQCMVEGQPTSALSWVQLFRTNIISVVVRLLSSDDVRMRKLAMTQLGILWKTLQNTVMQEKDEVLHILDLLRNLFPNSEEQPRITSYMTLLLAHALRGVFYPSNFVYPLISRFLLQRPELDPLDVPLLYGMLHSTSEDWKKERLWVVRYLADGMLNSDDWRVFKRRHTWDLLATLFQSMPHDRHLRHAILEVLASLTCNQQATTFLVLKSSLIHWAEMQIRSLKPDESIAWAKIMENIVVISDASKLEKATAGMWRESMVRCLQRLLEDAEIALVALISRILLRLATFHPEVAFLAEAVKLSLRRLKTFEETRSSIDPDKFQERTEIADLPPFRNPNFHVVSVQGWSAWGASVERLWQVAVLQDRKVDYWDDLTLRLLIWRSVSGAQKSAIGEWCRAQVVRCIGKT